MTPNNTVEYFFQKYIEKNKLKKTTERNYKTAYRAYIQKYGNLQITEVTDIFAREFVKEINRLQVNSIVWVKYIFSNILEEAIKNKVIDRNPFKELKIPKTPPVNRPQPFTTAEIKLILEEAKKEEWFGNFIAFLLLTGARIGEILALHWENVKEDKIIIAKTIYNGVIGTTKTGTVREIPIFNDLKPYIEAQKAYGTDGRIFRQVQGATSIFYRWRRLRNACGLGDRKLSNTRHTFAKCAIESGMKIEYLALLTGHTDPHTILKHYVRFLEPNRYNSNFTVFK
jgi:integrase